MIARSELMILVPFLLSIKITLQVTRHSGDLEGRLWVESYSSLKEWGLTVRHCRTQLKPERNPKNQDKEVHCQYEPGLIQHQWTLPEATSVNDQIYNKGITMTVFHPTKGNLLFNKVFPLWLYWAHWADLQWHLRRVSPGHLVILNIALTGTSGIRNATDTLQHMGSLLARHLTQNAHWSWVFIKGGQTISEAGVLHTKGDVHLHAQLPLKVVPYPEHYSKQEKARWSYCESVGGMGDLCDEYKPSLLPIPQAPRLDKAATDVLLNVPVIITAGNRQQYLYHTLSTLLAAHGSNKTNFLVVVGNKPPFTLKLLDLLGVSYTSLPLTDNKNVHLFNYYRSVFQLVTQKFVHAPAAIFLDEDVEVSKDFFSYMSQTLELLYKDPTLYCSNGFSSLGGSRTFTDETTIRRGSIQVEWGYTVTMDFMKEVLAKWSMDRPSTLLYDYYIYLNIRGNRECLFPEQSRTIHYGMGVNTATHLMEFHNFNINLVQKAPVRLQNVDKLEIHQWRSDLTLKIQHATPIVKSPCDEDFLPREPLDTNYVFYYKLDPYAGGKMPDSYQYYHPNFCLDLWAVSEQGHHEGVTLVHLAKEAYLYLVGVPYSSYSHLKPPHIPIWDVETITDEEFSKITQHNPVKGKAMRNANASEEQVLQELMRV